MPDEPLILRFDPQTVDHLGAKMYSHLPNAVAELVANAYDADATNVRIDVSSPGVVVIADDGHGMSRTDVSEKYLHIGRNRRAATSSDKTESGKRSVSGKKGLGKLALFGIGKTVEVSTTRAGQDYGTLLSLSYDAMMDAEGEYAPGESTLESTLGEHGTTVSLRDLKRSTLVDAKELATSLSRLFNNMDTSFGVTVVGKGGSQHPVTSSLRLAAVDVEFEWVFPDAWADADEIGRKYAISGRIVSARSPLRHGMRGITLYVKGRLANEPEYFGVSESSFAFSYLTGYLNVDYIDDLNLDVIATDRRALDWDTDETAELRDQLAKLMVRVGQEWRARRRELRERNTDGRLKVTVATWLDSIRSAEQVPLRQLVGAVTSEELDITSSQQTDIIRLLQEVTPPYAEYVWRHLHPEIQNATRAYYENADYFVAVQEAIKRYVSTVKKKSGTPESAATGIVAQAFGDKGSLKVFQKFMEVAAFDPQTAKDVETGQKHVSMGVVAGFRNPLAHEEVALLQSSGAFTSIDCLDALSIVSHLMRRLDGSQASAGA
jgi:uncharacterized protein (TIGR02391 family)